MPKTIVHYRNRDLPSGDVLPWEEAATERGFTVLKAYTPKQAGFLTKSNDCLALFMDLAPGDVTAPVRLREVLAATGDCSPLVVGLSTEPLPAGDLSELSWAGIQLVIPADAPVDFILHQLKTHQQIILLRRFEEEQDKLVNISKETRRQLHDINQPLTALMGRLHLLAAALPDDDPTCASVRELLPMVSRMSELIGDLQDYHRKVR